MTDCTEAHMLGLLNQRYGLKTNDSLPRWIYAEHVPLFDEQYRIIDAVALDCHNVPYNQRPAVEVSPYHVRRMELPHDVHGFEVKVSRSDWLSEYRTGGKKSSVWQKHCSHFWLVIPSMDIIREDEVPEHWGILVGTKRLRIYRPAQRILRQKMNEDLTRTINRYAIRSFIRHNYFTPKKGL